MLGQLIRKMQKGKLISALRVRMVWKRNIVRLGTRIVIIHISNKHAPNLHWTFIHIARCVCERCQVMDTYEEYVYTIRKLHQFQIKKIKMHYRICWILGEFILTMMFWKYLWMIFIIEFYWYFYESWLHMQDANIWYVDCEVTISHVETVNIIAPLLCSTSWTL